MADDSRDTPRPFDVRTVEYLLRLMTEHDLAEVDLKEGDQRIRLRKGSAIPAGFRRLVGVLEALGGLGLVLPAIAHILPVLVPWAATGLVVLMDARRAAEDAGLWFGTAAGPPIVRRVLEITELGPVLRHRDTLRAALQELEA